MLVVIAAGGLALVDNNKSMLEGFLHDLEYAARLVDGRGADRSDSELSVYHDALVQRFEAVISSVHAVLEEALMARGCPVRIGSNFNWVVRRAADEGLIGPSDRDDLETWVIDRHVTSHKYNPDAIDAVVLIVNDVIRCAWRVWTAL